jgi:hypothetical protein
MRIFVMGAGIRNCSVRLRSLLWHHNRELCGCGAVPFPRGTALRVGGRTSPR